MSLTIIKNGIADSLQDEGRFGYAGYGINPGGVTDRFAARVANFLVGNKANAPVLEMHFPGPQILFEQNALISITGADMQPTINGEPVDCWRPLMIRKNSLLQFSKLASGAWAYLSVHGGFEGMQWLGSSSTNIKAGAGGWKGRHLQKGDELPFGEMEIYYPVLMLADQSWVGLPWKADVSDTYHNGQELFVLTGAEWASLKPASQQKFSESKFSVLPSSDRMGYQLKGITLEKRDTIEMLSSAVNFGTIQLLPGGQLIVLMSDHQTTGGYPRIANVITAHLPKLAQLKTGDAVQYKIVDVALAEELLVAQQKHLQILQRSCQDQLNKYVCTALI
jgi:antagonist of KipI